MRVLLAVDKFKGTLTSAEVSQTLAAALTSAGHDTVTVPLADGGDGTVACAVASGFEAHSATVTGPLGKPVEATWASTTRPDGTRIAVIELAQASGIALIEPSRDTAIKATTYGTGELIRAALDAGCAEIVLGVGGSATTDGGLGMLRALGVAHSEWVPGAGTAASNDSAAGTDSAADTGSVTNAAGGARFSVDTSGLDPRVRETTFVLANDVENPLTGPNGAAAVYGPQKGASPEDVNALDAALDALASAVDPDGQCRNQPGAGAAGGTGFAAMAVLGAQQHSGADYLMELTGFSEALAGAEVLVTGEGKFDSQTLQGKGPGAAIQAANASGLPVWVVCGASEFPTGQPLKLNVPEQPVGTSGTAQTNPQNDEAGDKPGSGQRGAEPGGYDIAGVMALTDYTSTDNALANPLPHLEKLAADLAAVLG